ncbi:MAG: LysM peptidoglycan-binding domain-containing protein [Clostridia bacterium]|nr:LysM peptidoglycan-binding domain-containing protein [Clostridia bacterium]
MNKSFINWKRTAQIPATAEAGGEYILPNDLPDVKKILHVFTNLKNNGCFFDAPGVTADAELSYLIVYTGDDGKLHSVKYNAPVTAKSQSGVSDEAETAEAVFYTPDNQIRLSNPRKFQIKSRVPVQFNVYGKEEITPYIEGVQDSGLQCCEKNGVTYSVLSSREDDIPYSTDVQIPDSCPEPESLVSSYAVTSVPKVTAADGKAEISFFVDLMFVYSSSEGEAVSYKSTVDISHEIAADGMTEDSVCRGIVCANELNCELTTDKSGEMRVIEADLTYNAEILYETAERGIYVADMYSTEYESTETYADMTIRRAQPVFNTHFTVSGSADGEYAGDVLFATASCDKFELTNEDQSTVLSGIIEVYAVINENGEFEGATAAIPFRSVLQYSMNDNDEYNADVSVGMPTVRIDGNSIYMDAELYVSVYGHEYEAVKTVSAMTISDTPVDKSKPSLRLYRPDPGETDWDTAKRFKVSAEALQKANSLNNKKIYIIP